MCMFSQPIVHVGSTRILVTALSDSVHATVYRMSYEASAAVAMILPVPVLKGTGDDAITFVDLSDCRDFFPQLDLCFPLSRGRGSGGYGGGGDSIPRSVLAVHEVGDYVASYVPSISEFNRLDPRFRLPPAAWETLPDYRDFGFAVFQLQPGGEPRDVHPIAYRYPAERPGELFFPTVHLHDGGPAHPRADFDHILYSQPFREHSIDDEDFWRFGAILPREVMDVGRTKGLIAGDRRIGRLVLEGEYPNGDLVTKMEGIRPNVDARLVRVPWDLGPALTWRDFRDLRKSHGGYGPGYY